MSDTAGARDVVDPVAKAGYELEFEDTFDGDTLDPSRWLPHYLPQWSSREAAAARYQLGDGILRNIHQRPTDHVVVVVGSVDHDVAAASELSRGRDHNGPSLRRVEIRSR